MSEIVIAGMMLSWDEVSISTVNARMRRAIRAVIGSENLSEREQGEGMHRFVVLSFAELGRVVVPMGLTLDVMPMVDGDLGSL